MAVLHCPDYDESKVEEAVGRGFDLLGGTASFARAGERIVLKPNLVVASAPSAAVTTHPAVFRAVARHLGRRGCHLLYGDSPGIGTTIGAARRAGIAGVAEEEGVALADFSTPVILSFSQGGQNKQFTIAAGVHQADGLISLPKLKAHGLTRITGAIKNQFGCVPGLLKSEFHLRMDDADQFGRMLVDLNRLLNPRLFVMDAIVAMEGNGPRSGDPHRLSTLLMSADPVALDTVACRLIGLDPQLVVTIHWGHELGLGTRTNIDLVGDPLEPLVTRSFVVNRTPGSTTGVSGRLGRIARNFVVPRPVIRPNLCTACGTCVSICPVTPKAVDFEETPGEAPPAEAPAEETQARVVSVVALPEEAAPAEAEAPGDTPPGRPGRRRHPTHHYSRCIRCYCCQEMCPQRAIEIERPLLGRILHR